MIAMERMPSFPPPILARRSPSSTSARPAAAAMDRPLLNTRTASTAGPWLRASRRLPPAQTATGSTTFSPRGNPLSPVFVTNVSTATCSRCHGDTRLERRFNLPLDRVTSYENSYHGLASKAGSQTVANCASCHGVHDILPSSDPRSSIAKGNLAATCGKCHPDAGKTFALGPVHVLPSTATANPGLRYVRLFYLFTIPAALGFMLFHNLLDWLRKLRRHIAQYGSLSTPLRLTLNQRVQHSILLRQLPSFGGYGLCP